MRNRRHQWRFTQILFLWAVLFLSCTFLIRREIIPRGPISWAAVALPTAIAFIAVMAFGNFLRHADEMQREIQLTALAHAVGAWFVVWTAGRLIEGLGATWGVWPDMPVLAMTTFYLVGIARGRNRYK